MVLSIPLWGLNQPVRSCLPPEQLCRGQTFVQLQPLGAKPVQTPSHELPPTLSLTNSQNEPERLHHYHLPPPVPIPCSPASPHLTSLPPHNYPTTHQPLSVLSPKAVVLSFLYTCPRHDNPDTVDSVLTRFWFGTHCSYACVSIAVLDRPFTLISLLTSTDAVYPVMAFCFSFPFSLFVFCWFEVFWGQYERMVALVLLVSALNSSLFAAWWVDCTCDSHLASFIAAQFPTVDVSLHSHAMCQTSLLCALVLYLELQNMLICFK